MQHTTPKDKDRRRASRLHAATPYCFSAIKMQVALMVAFIAQRQINILAIKIRDHGSAAMPVNRG